MHFEKFKTSQVVALLKHYTREHITDNVIQEKIKDNVVVFNDKYNELLPTLTDKEKSIYRKDFFSADSVSDFMNVYIHNKIKKNIRADQNVMIDLIITQPEYLGQNVDMKFFNKMIDTLHNYKWKDRNIFDKNNMVCYAIHQDEKGQPHLHYSFMPIYENDKVRIKENKNKKTNKVYKRNTNMRLTSDFMNKEFLENFHKEMERLTDYKLTNDNGIKKDLSMKEYQQQQEIKKQQERIKENEKKIENNKNIITDQEKKLDNEIKEKENKIKEYNDIINSYDYNYQTHNKIELQKPTEIKKTFAKENEITLDRKSYNYLLKQVNELEFATSNDYNKRTTLKEKLDKDIKDKENYLKNINNNDFIDLKLEIQDRDKTIAELKSKNTIQDTKINNLNNLLQDQERETKKWYGSWQLERKENDAIKSVLDKNNILDKVMDLVQKILKAEKGYTQ